MMILVSRAMFWGSRNQMAAFALMVGLSVCLSVHLSTCPFICLSDCPVSVCLQSVHLSVCPSYGQSNCLYGLHRGQLLTVTGDCSCLFDIDILYWRKYIRIFIVISVQCSIRHKYQYTLIIGYNHEANYATFTPRYEWVRCGPVWKRNLDSTTRDHTGRNMPHEDPQSFLAFTPNSDAVWDTSKK